MTAGSSPGVVAVAPVAVTVPNVLSLDQATAAQDLAGVGLTVGHISWDTRCIDVQGGVLVQNPIGGALVLRGTAVNLTVSTGTDAEGNPCIFK